MYRLSAVIPAVGSQQSFEETLVSVLSNRPTSSEIIVACPASYSDQYGLEDEVRFVRVDSDSTNWPLFANVGLRVAQGAYVNLILPGVEVLDDWDVAAIDRLQRTSRMGSVAPLMQEETGDAPQAQTLAAGLNYAPDQPNRVRRFPANRRDHRLPFRIDGPAAACGFFRRQDLLDLGGWDERLPAEIADVDLSLRLRRQGLASVCEPTSRVICRESFNDVSRVDARVCEQLYWRYFRQVGPRAWFGYLASWTNLARIPKRLGGIFRSPQPWTANDFLAATAFADQPELPTRRAA